VLQASLAPQARQQRTLDPTAFSKVQLPEQVNPWTSAPKSRATIAASGPHTTWTINHAQEEAANDTLVEDPCYACCPVRTVAYAPFGRGPGKLANCRAHGLALLTDYPSQVIGFDESRTFRLTLRGATEPQIVDLEMDTIPKGCSTSFRAGGAVIKSVYKSLTGLELLVLLV
jgi:hypothetical protein